MPFYFDQLGPELSLESRLERIVSLVPSITELLVDLGLRDALVGCTKFCVHPPELRREIQVVGGTRKFHLDRVAALNPDLIIAVEEENDPAQVLALAEKYPVWVGKISNWSSAESMILALGERFCRKAEASQIIRDNRQGLSNLRSTDPGSALYLIWREPYMSVGGDTYLHDTLSRAGYENVCAQMERYPELSAGEIRRLSPKHILLSSEPYPFKAAHLEELRQLCPRADIRLVDGELWSWYGSRLAHYAREKGQKPAER